MYLSRIDKVNEIREKTLTEIVALKEKFRKEIAFYIKQNNIEDCDMTTREYNSLLLLESYVRSDKFLMTKNFNDAFVVSDRFVNILHSNPLGLSDVLLGIPTPSDRELSNSDFVTIIEGANTTYKRTQKIHNGEPVDENNYFSEMMILGGFKATKFLNLHGNKLNENILLNMWNILVDGACQNEDIRGTKYRTGNVGVGSHMGLNYELVDDAMQAWIGYYNSDVLNDHPFIKAALLHFTFEYIHPFCDGNGRAGRLLMVNFLVGQGFDVCKAVSFSRSIEKNRAAYDNAFVLSENSYSDVTPFIEYMLNIYADAFYDCIEKNMEEDYSDRT